MTRGVPCPAILYSCRKPFCRIESNDGSGKYWQHDAKVRIKHSLDPDWLLGIRTHGRDNKKHDCAGVDVLSAQSRRPVPECKQLCEQKEIHHAVVGQRGADPKYQNHEEEPGY